jgi:hypothetical protein
MRTNWQLLFSAVGSASTSIVQTISAGISDVTRTFSLTVPNAAPVGVDDYRRLQRQRWRPEQSRVARSRSAMLCASGHGPRARE